MRKNPASENGLYTPRVLAALVLMAIGASFAVLSFAANPSGGTVSPSTGAPVTWQGTAAGVPATAVSDCEDGVNCDSFKLTISGTPADWGTAGKYVRVRIQWLSPSTDYDMEVHKGSIDGPVVASSGAGGRNFEEVILNPRSQSIGTGDFYVRAVYFAATSADQYNGFAAVETAGPAPVPAAQASGVAPRYQNYTPPANGLATLGLDAGEPSIGVSWTSETGQNGGRAMYIAFLQTLRLTFNDSCPSSPSALWEDKSFPTTATFSQDPILFTDRVTGRTIVSQLVLGAGVLTTLSAYTDNDGDLWKESTGAGIGQGTDHQTVGGGGPFHTPLIGGAYPNAVYYCAQLPTSSCALSTDGGQTFGPAVPAYTDQCGGLHGHIKVGPDGTAYLPNKNCAAPIPGQAVVVTEDNGVTWQPRPVPGSLGGSSDAAVGIGRGDKTGGKGRVYIGYADADGQAVIATSTNHGLNWTPAVDVGAVFGINNVVFPAVVAGDDDRAAFAFYGTPTAGGLQDARFPGIWHLYIAHTYDGGQSWHTVDATPDDPMQRGCIWLQGGANICRNMLDFAGIDVDKRGRVLVGYNDGCAGAECSQAATGATGNSYTALAAVARQTAGKGLFAQYDSIFPDAPTTPGVPVVTALRNGGVVHLKWSTSNNGGSPVTGYTISRGAASGAESVLATVPGNQLSFNDAGATDPNATYYYKVAATNAVGSSCGNNEVPAPYFGNSSTGLGYRIFLDPTAEAGPPAANPDLDIQTLSILEPSSGPNAGKLVFNLKVTNLALSPNERMWRIIWSSPNAVDLTQDPPANVGQFYVGMTKDAAGAVTFEYGTVETSVIGLAVGRPRTKRAGDADAGSGFTPDGLITIVVSKNKVGAPRTGDLLGDFLVRTFSVDSEEIRTSAAIDQAINAAANDFTANAATYMLVGPVPGVADVVSRKTHGAAGAFDVSLLPGTSGVEPRRGSGANSGDHQIVFRFLQPVTFTNATVTPAGSISSTSPNNVPSTEVIVNLTGVANAQTLNVNLNGVTLNGTTTNLSSPIGFLLGDSNGDRSVNSGDAQQTRNRSGQLTNGANFRSDVNTDGTVNSGDAFIVRANSGKGL